MERNPHSFEDMAYEIAVKAEAKILRRLLNKWLKTREVKDGNAFSKEWNRQYVVTDNDYEE